MATEYLDPNSNITSVWKTYNYTNIDNGVRQPSTNTSDYIQWNKSDDDEIQAYGMSNLSSLTSITSIKVWVYGKRTSHDPDLQCRINVGGSYEDYQNFGLTSTSSWHSLTFNGTWTDTDVNALGVYFLSGSIGGFSDNKIYLVYAEITGTAHTVFTKTAYDDFSFNEQITKEYIRKIKTFTENLHDDFSFTDLFNKIYIPKPVEGGLKYRHYLNLSKRRVEHEIITNGKVVNIVGNNIKGPDLYDIFNMGSYISIGNQGDLRILIK